MPCATESFTTSSGAAPASRSSTWTRVITFAACPRHPPTACTVGISRATPCTRPSIPRAICGRPWSSRRGSPTPSRADGVCFRHAASAVRQPSPQLARTFDHLLGTCELPAVEGIATPLASIHGFFGATPPSIGRFICLVQRLERSARHRLQRRRDLADLVRARQPGAGTGERRRCARSDTGRRRPALAGRHCRIAAAARAGVGVALGRRFPRPHLR